MIEKEWNFLKENLLLQYFHSKDTFSFLFHDEFNNSLSPDKINDNKELNLASNITLHNKLSTPIIEPLLQDNQIPKSKINMDSESKLLKNTIKSNSKKKNEKKEFSDLLFKPKYIENNLNRNLKSNFTTNDSKFNTSKLNQSSFYKTNLSIIERNSIMSNINSDKGLSPLSIFNSNTSISKVNNSNIQKIQYSNSNKINLPQNIIILTSKDNQNSIVNTDQINNEQSLNQESDLLQHELKMISQEEISLNKTIIHKELDLKEITTQDNKLKDLNKNNQLLINGNFSFNIEETGVDNIKLNNDSLENESNSNQTSKNTLQDFNLFRKVNNTNDTFDNKSQNLNSSAQDKFNLELQNVNKINNISFSNRKKTKKKNHTKKKPQTSRVRSSFSSFEKKPLYEFKERFSNDLVIRSSNNTPINSSRRNSSFNIRQSFQNSVFDEYLSSVSIIRPNSTRIEVNINNKRFEPKNIKKSDLNTKEIMSTFVRPFSASYISKRKKNNLFGGKDLLPTLNQSESRKDVESNDKELNNLRSKSQNATIKKHLQNEELHDINSVNENEEDELKVHEIVNKIRDSDDIKKKFEPLYSIPYEKDIKIQKEKKKGIGISTIQVVYPSHDPQSITFADSSELYHEFIQNYVERKYLNSSLQVIEKTESPTKLIPTPPNKPKNQISRRKYRY